MVAVRAHWSPQKSHSNWGMAVLEVSVERGVNLIMWKVYLLCRISCHIVRES